MKIKLICVGRLKEDFYKGAAAEYSKRLSRFHKFELIEIPEEIKSDSPGEAEIKKALDTEASKILKALGKNAFVISLAIEGSHMSSEAFAKRLKALADTGKSEADFIIGGSYGLSDKVLSASDLLLSFSKMTFTYQLARVIFLEQIYRASKINAGETYHK